MVLRRYRDVGTHCESEETNGRCLVLPELLMSLCYCSVAALLALHYRSVVTLSVLCYY